MSLRWCGAKELRGAAASAKPHLREQLRIIAPHLHLHHQPFANLTGINRTNMSSNVGLSTPRGSGTSGYVQKNRSLLKPRDKAAPYSKDWDSAKHRQRQPDPEILEHDRKREIEVKVLELRDKLEDEGYADALEHLKVTCFQANHFCSLDEDEIDDRCDGLRKKLEEERKAGKGTGPDARSLKSHQVHDLAQVSDLGGAWARPHTHQVPRPRSKKARN